MSGTPAGVYSSIDAGKPKVGRHGILDGTGREPAMRPERRIPVRVPAEGMKVAAQVKKRISMHAVHYFFQRLVFGGPVFGGPVFGGPVFGVFRGTVFRGTVLRGTVLRGAVFQWLAFRRRHAGDSCVVGLIIALAIGTHWQTQAWGGDRGDGSVADRSTAATRIADDLAYLASDELAGRGVGTEGIQRAAQYIAERFQGLGLETTAFDESPYQEFTIPGPAVLGGPEENMLAFSGPRLEAGAPKLSVDFTPLSLGKSGKFSGPVAFAGYGITASELNYDDYSGFDPAGKVVIVIRKEPQQAKADSKFDGTQNSQYAFFTSKELNAALHKVAALVLVDDAATAAAALKQKQDDLARAVETLEGLKRSVPPNASDERERFDLRVRSIEQHVAQLQDKIKQGGEGGLLGVNDAGSALSDQQVPTFTCSRNLVNRLLVAGGGKTLEELEAAIDRSCAPQSFVLDSIHCVGEAKIESSHTPVRNVIAVCPGSGTLADQYVVIGAHYDHVGMGGRGSLAPGTVAVHNGADDNGSGTATLLEVARQLAATTAENRRTLIFMAFSAEESGLLGSVYYVRHPRWPLEKTVAMINLDMVGRLNNDELTVYGTGTAAEFSSQIDRLNERYRFKIMKVPQGRGASDHASFYEAKIPVYHFFTGLHNDYHRPSDDVEKVNVPGMVRISQMVTEVVREIAEAPQRPQVMEIKGSANPRRQSGSRATLGIRLDRAAEAAPKIVGVEDGGPAATAGLQPGDVIIQINAHAIASISDLRQALSQSKPGDTVEVTYRRENVAKTVAVKLGE